MNIKRAVFMAVLVVAIAALAVPLVGLRAAASGSGTSAAGAAAKARAASAANAGAQQIEQQRAVSSEVQTDHVRGCVIPIQKRLVIGASEAVHRAVIVIGKFVKQAG